MIFFFFNAVVKLGFTTPHSNFISYFSHRSDNTICSLFITFFFLTREGGNGQKKDKSISNSFVNI